MFKIHDSEAEKLHTEADSKVLNGEVVGMLGTNRDVTNHKESSDRLNYIIDSAQVAFFLTVDGIVAEANKYSQKYIGINIGDDIRPYYNVPGFRDTIIKLAERQGTASNITVKFNMAKGEIHRFLSSFTCVEYEQRKAYLVWAIDVEQNELKKDQLRAVQLSFQSVLDTLPMPIRIVDLENEEIIYVNDSFLEMFEYDSADDVCGLNIKDILADVMNDEVIVAEREEMILKAERPSSTEVVYRTNTGKEVEAVVATRRIDYRGKRASIGIIKDLTAEKEQARIMLNAAEREKEANQMKSLFLANMSHEIRTPMNGIIGMTDLLLSEKLSGRQLKYVKDIKSSAESLLGIINDILDLSKISEGRLQIIPVDIYPYTFLKNISSLMSFTANAKNLDFIDDIRIAPLECVRLDDVRLQQVIINLLSNAIKFTKKGHVKLSAEISDDKINLAISDTGMGIKQEDIPLIFAEFGQVDTRKNRAIKGTGLGLSISKNLVALMGGNLWVESVYEKGTTFHLTIPYVLGDESAVEVIDTEFKYIYAPTAQILLVDDIQTNLTVGAGLLRLCGITADVAMSGFEAIELVKTKDYDIVLMDHMMPEMDGIETMLNIRGLGEKQQNLPIVALTANAMNESKELLIASGMSDFLSKPIDKVALMGVLNKWLPRHTIEEPVTESEPDENSAPYSDILNLASKIEGLDIKTALNRIGGIQDVLESSLKQVANSTEELLKAMDACLSVEDLHGFSINAHGLKGAFANIGAANNSELAAELEIAAKADNLSLCISKFTAFVDIAGSFARDLKLIFKQSVPQTKLEGDVEQLLVTVNEIMSFLDSYESENALKRIKELEKSTYNAETDTILQNAKNAIEAFDYEKAMQQLEKVLDIG